MFFYAFAGSGPGEAVLTQGQSNKSIDNRPCQSQLHDGKRDNTKSDLCDTCKAKETISHYINLCKIYEEDRHVLEKDVERILASYCGLQHIPEINLKLMTGNSEETTRAANLELRGALARFIARTGRFTQSKIQNNSCSRICLVNMQIRRRAARMKSGCTE